MGALIRISALVGAFLVGCTSTVQVGLANAPVLGGATPETRVHDVIANGPDSCERSGFPPGDVLKGHIPPCVKKERLAKVPDFLWNPPPPSPWMSPWYPRSVCPSARPGLARSEKSMAAVSLSSSPELACNEPW
jgi:hypothetical protein